MGRPVRNLKNERGRVMQSFQIDVALAHMLNEKAAEAGVAKRDYLQALLVMVRDGQVDPRPLLEAELAAANA